ncbi:MAG TPA: nucleotidyltransferase family protein, partial [Polyangiaceae bacterium]
SLGSGWPEQHRDLLLAACAPVEAATAAWQRWSSGFSVEMLHKLDLGAARLLAQVSARLHRIGVRDALLARAFSVYRHTWCTNELRLHHLAEPLDALEKAGIDVLALKGLALLAGVYADVGLRPMYDVDLLVHASDLTTATCVLGELGWKFTSGESPSTTAVRPLPHHYSLQLRRDQLELDLHWHALRRDSSAVFDEIVWKYATTKVMSGSSIRCPQATELLIIVCIHGIAWNVVPSTLWAADAHRIITLGDAIDWDRFVATVTTRRLTLPIYDGLRFLTTVLNANVPHRVLEALGRASIWEVETLEYAGMTRRFTHSRINERWAARYMMSAREADDLATAAHLGTTPHDHRTTTGDGALPPHSFLHGGAPR